MKQFLLFIFFFTWQVAAFAHDAVTTEQVSVVGVGEVEAEPDQVTFYVSVYAIEKDLETAKRVADQRYQSVLDEIKKVGINDKKVKVVRLEMRPEYEWSANQQVYKGERVSRSITIVMTDLSKVTPLLQAMVEKGVSTVDNMVAGFQDEAAIKRDALGKATIDAKGKAAFLAKQLDRKLGVAFNIVEQGGGAQLYREYDMMSTKSMAAESYAPPEEMLGTQKILATVTVAFKLQ